MLLVNSREIGYILKCGAMADCYVVAPERKTYFRRRRVSIFSLTVIFTIHLKSVIRCSFRQLQTLDWLAPAGTGAFPFEALGCLARECTPSVLKLR